MQFTKDTFLMTLQQRLAGIDAARTVTLGAVTMPAVIADENQPKTATAPLSDTFYLTWGAMEIASGAENATCPLMKMQATIRYRTTGAAASSTAAGASPNESRGRGLAVLDQDLLRMCSPPGAVKCDYTQTPPLALGSNVFWSEPKFGAIEDAHGELRRAATMNVFFFPEVDL